MSGGRLWTKDEVALLEEMYKNQDPLRLIAETLGRTPDAVSTKANKLGFTHFNIKPNNPKYKAIYQDYDWCFENYIIKSKSHDEMAKEAGVHTRTIEKWCSDIHGLNIRTFKKFKEMSSLQRKVIMAGSIGDGHITKNPERPLYIESHAEYQKDYMFWKYDLLKDLCASEPKYYPPIIKAVNGKECQCQASYRIHTRVLLELNEIRDMRIIDKLKMFDGLCMALHFLDDGCRSNGAWEVALAEFTPDEIDAYSQMCARISGANGSVRTTNGHPYLGFRLSDSLKIDRVILENIPNDLDIVKYKIGGKCGK